MRRALTKGVKMKEQYTMLTIMALGCVLSGGCVMYPAGRPVVSQAPQPQQYVEQKQPLSIEDVKALAKSGVTNDVIISQIRNSRTVYRLNTAQIIDLKNSGVSETVIDFMINTPSTTPLETTYATGVQPQPMVQRVVVDPCFCPFFWPCAWGWGWGGGWHGGGGWHR